MILWKDIVKNNFSDVDFFFTRHKNEKVCDNIFCFDIETTSIFIHPDGTVHPFDKQYDEKFYRKCRKVGFVYIWQFSIENIVIYGRFLEDYYIFLQYLLSHVKARICVFVHNLSFETQFLRNIFNDNVEIFARKKRKPLYIRDGMVEYRCTYMLTRLSLAKWAEGKKLPVQKMEGDLDYGIIRTPYTQLSDKELGYCENDVLVMYHGILQFLEEYKTVWDIPLTQTGIVRREFNNGLSKNDNLHKKMAKLVPDNIELYTLLLNAFWGGIAHASYKWCNELLTNLESYDLKSSYPWVLISEMFPSTPFIKCRYNDRYINNKAYSYLITVELYNIQSSMWHSYISLSKCLKYNRDDNLLVDNGRIISASYVLITCTNIDYEIILESYKIKEKKVLDFRISTNYYLPNEIRLFIIEWYEKKCTLDGVEGMESMYLKSKEFINAIFGMMVTRIITDDIIYENEKWDKKKLDEKMFIKKTKKQLRNRRKLNNSFQWGVWVTAYARKNLWESVKATDEVSVYLDTDSNKGFFTSEKIKHFFDNYNKNIFQKQDKIAKDLGIEVTRIRPARPDGKLCPMGIYEHDGSYEEFKTLGAKKYCYKQDGEIHITVSGVRKQAAKQLKSVDEFADNFVFDIEHAEKLIMHYIDDQDYVLVNKGKYDEFACMYKYGICAQNTTYSLGLSEDFEELLDDFIQLKSKYLILEKEKIVEKLLNEKKKEER